tara:strand:- start:11 stop:256 length:246 start_codon:yes stop_codon:yes gene_type:complete
MESSNLNTNVQYFIKKYGLGIKNTDNQVLKDVKNMINHWLLPTNMDYWLKVSQISNDSQAISVFQNMARSDCKIQIDGLSI